MFPVKNQIPDFKFIDDFKAVTWKEDGIVYCTPTATLTEEEKEYIYEQKAKQGYG